MNESQVPPFFAFPPVSERKVAEGNLEKLGPISVVAMQYIIAVRIVVCILILNLVLIGRSHGQMGWSDGLVRHAVGDQARGTPSPPATARCMLFLTCVCCKERERQQSGSAKAGTKNEKAVVIQSPVQHSVLAAATAFVGTLTPWHTVRPSLLSPGLTFC